ncbi:MAG: TerB family tellurite resistance protein [Halofilum sp. (in: g-proteobacteria)]|nr:TerB family tellurite resistance protein [Halofilum sp. (in: g-proteobacteria)]
MLPRIQEFFRDRLAPEAEHAGSTAHRLNLATAALLIEIARADSDFDASEQSAIESMLVQTLELPAEEIAALVRLATEESRESISLHEFTRLVNEHYSIDEKRRLMEQLWRVAHADGRIDRYEEQLLRRIADLLHIRHSEFMQAKHAAGE